LQLNFQQELDLSTKYFPEKDYGNVKFQWQTLLGGASARLQHFQAKGVQTFRRTAMQGLQGHFALSI